MPDEAGAAQTTARDPRRARVGLIVGGIAVALSGTLAPEPAVKPTAGGEDAVIAQTVPAPTVAYEGVDGTSVVFAVSHDPAEDGDLYRWLRADGSGDVAVSEGPTIAVDNSAGGVVCIDVQVQRGSKTSEEIRECSP